MTLLPALAIASFAIGCSPALPHAPAKERSGIDEEIEVARAEESGEELVGERGRALHTVLQLRDRATPDVKVEVDGWLATHISTFQQMESQRRVVDRLPVAAPYEQAERDYARWIETTHPEEHDSFAVALFGLDDQAFPNLDRAALALRLLTVRSGGAGTLGALDYLARSTRREQRFRATLTSPAYRPLLRRAFRVALGGMAPWPDEPAWSSTRCRSVATTSALEETTFATLWRAVDADRASWDEGARALGDVHPANAALFPLAPLLKDAWFAHPERHGAILFVVASLLPNTERPAMALSVKLFEALATTDDLDRMLAFDPRAVLILPRLFAASPNLPSAGSFLAAVARFAFAEPYGRLRQAGDPSLAASIATFGGHLCTRQVEAGPRDDFSKCTNDQTMDLELAIQKYGSDC